MSRTPPIRPILALLAALAVASCATTQRLAAASDVHALMVAIRDDDRAAFDAHVDRRALEAQLQSRLVDRAAASNLTETWKGLGVLLSGPLSRAAGSLLLRPDVFRAVAEYYGYRPDAPIPNALVLAGALKSLPDGRVCATRRTRGPCLVTFADEGGTWRLVRVDADPAMLASKPR